MQDHRFVHAIDPVLLHVAGVNLYYYGLAYAVGFLGIHLWLRAHRGRLGWRVADVYDFSILAAFCVLLFGRLFSVFVYQWDYYTQHPSQLISYWRGGMATHGVLLGGLIAVLVMSRRRREPFLRLADEIADPAVFLLAVGRIGNFINGQITGTPTNAWWGVKYPGVDGFRHPVTLYEALKNLTLIPILLVVRRNWPEGSGMVTAHFLFWYGFLRIFTDLFREHPGSVLGFGGSQYFNVLMALAGLGMMVALRNKSDHRSGVRASGDGTWGGRGPVTVESVENSFAYWLRRVCFALILLFCLVIRSAWTPEELERRREALRVSTIPASYRVPWRTGATLLGRVAESAEPSGSTAESLAQREQDMGKLGKTIVDEWAGVKAPPPPKLSAVEVCPATTALLILDIQNQNCSAERRPRCLATLPGIQGILREARSRQMPVVYSLTSRAVREDIRKEVYPLPEEPVVRASVDKFHGTELEPILRSRGVRTVIVVGTSAHGAVLHTAVGAAVRGFDVIVPVDGMSADDPYPEQYAAWHLANSPGSRQRTTLTRFDLMTFEHTPTLEGDSGR